MTVPLSKAVASKQAGAAPVQMFDRGFFAVAGGFMAVGLVLLGWGGWWFYDVARFIRQAEKIPVQVQRINAPLDDYGEALYTEYTFADASGRLYTARPKSPLDRPTLEASITIYHGLTGDPSHPERVMIDAWKPLWLAPTVLAAFGVAMCLPCLIGLCFRQSSSAQA